MKRAMITCEEALAYVSLELENLLEEEERGLMLLHFDDCEVCSEVAYQMRALDQVLYAAPMKYAPTGFTQRAVSAAFEAEMRRNLWLGLATLLVGAMVMGGFFVVGQAELLWSLVATIMAPGFSSAAWLDQIMRGLTIGWEVGVQLISIARSMLVGPLLLPSLISLLAALSMALFLRLGGRLRLSSVRRSS